MFIVGVGRKLLVLSSENNPEKCPTGCRSAAGLSKIVLDDQLLEDDDY